MIRSWYPLVARPAALLFLVAGLLSFSTVQSALAQQDEDIPMWQPDFIFVFFETDDHGLNDVSTATIDEAVAKAAQLGDVEFSITGYADRQGPEDYNMKLSLRRAESVKEAMVARGVAADRISVAARGESGLRVKTVDGIAEPANRRVEIIVQ